MMVNTFEPMVDQLFDVQDLLASSRTRSSRYDSENCFVQLDGEKSQSFIVTYSSVLKDLISKHLLPFDSYISINQIPGLNLCRLCVVYTGISRYKHLVNVTLQSVLRLLGREVEEPLEDQLDLLGPAYEEAKPVENKVVLVESKPRCTDSLSQLVADGCYVFLPVQQLPDYPAIKRLLETAGGKYGRYQKRSGFKFDSDASLILDKLVGGEKLNPKKEFQLFETPQTLCSELVLDAGVEPGMSAFEPSAGNGRIVRELLRLTNRVTAVELNPIHECNLLDVGVTPIVGDFLSLDPDQLGHFDRIVANPPFRANQDIAHVTHMIKFLAPKGRLVSVMSPQWQTGRTRAHKDFKALLADAQYRVEVTPIPTGAFKESGTSISTVKLILEKR